MSHVFVSYLHENDKEIQMLYTRLTSYGVEVWLDRYEIKPGTDWRLAILEAIQEGNFFIACFSKEYNDRNTTFMNEELALAIEQLRRRPIDQVWFIPVLFSGKVPNWPIRPGQTLRDLEWVELDKEEKWENGIQKILKVILRSSFYKAKRLAKLLTSIKDNPSCRNEFDRILEELNMVYVEAGTFTSGSDRYGEPGKFEGPNLGAFCIDKYPVTNWNYMQFVKVTEHSAPDHWCGANCPDNLLKHPVKDIHYTDAQKFAQWAGKRLPTQWEWEKAARGTDGREFPWGDEFESQRCNTRESVGKHTNCIGKYSGGVSPYRCWDMAGNVWEWTLTPEGQNIIPLLHGGSCMYYQYQARCSYRIQRERIRDENIGFRCVIGPDTQNIEEN